MKTDGKLATNIINTIRTLSMDAVQKANSGHPGTPMALAPVAFTIYDAFLRFNPENPLWPNRDRFVLSAGHASMLIYSLLHVMGYDVSLEDIRNFRQLHSNTAGHPEYGMTPGVEMTTGPLGQGVGTSVGMAIAEKWLKGYFNRPDFDIMDYNIFAVASDGCIMEGISHEAASIAGHLGLDNLIWIYDNNQITIEGSTDLAFSEDVRNRFEAYQWHVQHVDDANDTDALGKSIRTAIAEKEKPSLIIVDSHIAWGAPNKQDTADAHGAPLGEDEIRATKSFYGWDPDKSFYVPEDVMQYSRKMIQKGRQLEQNWNMKFEEYEAKHPDLAHHFRQIQNGELPGDWDDALPAFPADEKGMATRQSNGKILNAVAEAVPWLLGGSADLEPSNKSRIAASKDFSTTDAGRNFHFGVREHAMGAIVNGMALSGLRSYGATFFVFSDYMRPAIRLAALMELPVIYIYTHDSIGLGEDGPTHQPVEHLASLRAMPNLDVIRPADANELSVLWKHVMESTHRPSALVLTRQGVPTLDRRVYASAELALKGAYVLFDSAEDPDVILIGTGSELHLCIKAAEELALKNIKCRVVSMPCQELFDRQPESYKREVLPEHVRARVALEAGSEFGWDKYVGDNGIVIGMHSFGESAPYKQLYDMYGITVENIVGSAAHAVSMQRLKIGTGFSMRVHEGMYELEAALDNLEREDVVQRIWKHDHTVWKRDPAEISNRLGWLHSPEVMMDAFDEIQAFVDKLKREGLTHALLLGMGGSSLAPEVYRMIFGVKSGYLDLQVLDSTTPGAVLDAASELEPAKTLYIISTKSGGTVETISFMKYFYNQVMKEVGEKEAGSHFIAITDPGSGLEKMAGRLDFRKTFLNDPDIGGRYSALSYFGLVPAALVGIDVRKLLERASTMTSVECGCGKQASAESTMLQLGAAMGILAQQGRDKVTFVASAGIAPFGAWVEQLIAESMGKEGKGILPVIGESLLEPKAYAGDRLFVQLKLGEDSDLDSKIDALHDAGHPVARVNMTDLYDLGAEFFRWEMATAIAGYFLKINPFDQPNVESAKVLAKKMVAAYEKDGALPRTPPAYEGGEMDIYARGDVKDAAEALGQLFSQIDDKDSKPRSYIALQAFIQPGAETDRALQSLRDKIQQKYRVAVTIGYGPRFLHSTGQLHKGDAGNGLFIQITEDFREDAPIPDEPGAESNTMTFGVLASAQALGDRQALIDAGRPVIRFHFKRNAAEGIERLAKEI
jgi:transketolase